MSITHTLGAILMRFEVMTAGEFDKWISEQGYTPEKATMIKNDIVAQKKGAKTFSYAKVY